MVVPGVGKHGTVQSVDEDQPTGGEPPGFDAVYRDQRRAIVRLAYLLVRSHAVAEELAQEAFLRLYTNFATVENPPGFLRTVVVRLAHTWRGRRDMEHERLERVDRLDPPPTDTIHEPDETWEAIGRLRPERATVLVLRFYEDLSHDEIAAVVGCSAATVRSRVRRALHDLGKEIHP